MVEYKDSKWINNIGVYFVILNDINHKIFELIKYEDGNVEEIELLFFDICVNLNRIIPMKFKNLSKNDGILKLKEFFDFLLADYDILFNKYSGYLNTINDIRNKFEHVPHTIKWKKYIGYDKYKKIIFINDEYNNDIFDGKKESLEKREKNGESYQWEIDTNIFIEIIVDINRIFLKIQNQVKNYFCNNKEALSHPYIKRILNTDIYSNINNL